MNILITGIHGFVGNNLVVALKNQHTIYGLDIVSPKKDGIVKTFGWNELEQIPSVDVIIHLAGKAHDTKNQTDALVYFEINTGLTQRIFDWFLISNAKKFIFFSSVKAAANHVDGDFLTEEVIPAPKGPYGESKIAAENYILSRKSDAGSRTPEISSPQSPDFSLRHASPFDTLLDTISFDMQRTQETRYSRSRLREQTQGADLEPGTWNLEPETLNLEPETWNKSVYILRPCMIHGPGNKGNLNLLYKLVQKGFPWPLGAFENKRSFTSIDNLTYIISQLIEKDIEPGIYQVADDEALSTNEIIRLIAEAQNQKTRIWNISKKLISSIARVGDFLHLPLNNQRLKKLTESYVVSNQKIKKALNIEKMPVTAEEGLKKTFESFQDISN